ncbi:Hypothetical predicted protein, partial [Pelobates cultripes]
MNMGEPSQQTPPDFQALINSAVAASMEKAIAKLLVQTPQGDPDTKGQEKPSGDSAPPKRHWKGNGPAPRTAKGKAPLKRSRPSDHLDPSTPPLTSSDDEGGNSPTPLEVMDEWGVGDSPSEEEDWLDIPRGHTGSERVEEQDIRHGHWKADTQ